MKYYVLLIALIFIAGCTSDFFGGDVLKIQVNTEAEGPKDAVIVKDIQTIPSPPVLPGQQVSLFFTIENKDDLKSATNVNVNLFNPSSFRIIEGGAQPLGSALPGEQKQVEMKLAAPTQGEIANVRLETDLHFSVAYDFQSSTIMETLIVNENEIRARQRQGQPVSLERNTILGSGPVQIDGEMKGVPYVLANQPGTAGIFVLTVVNRGDKTKGDLKDGKILAGNLAVEFPAGIGNMKCPEKFSQNGLICTNAEEIKLFKGESNPFRFEITGSPPISEPFKTYNIKADISYTYELRDSAHAIVNPLENV